MNTSASEFKIFYENLVSNAPPNYTAWLFPVKHNKAPDPAPIGERAPAKAREKYNEAKVAYEAAKKTNNKAIIKAAEDALSEAKQGVFSWKAPHARLTKEEAIERLEKGGNVGISARANDRLVIVDVDVPSHVKELKPTLTTQSRKRVGAHGFYWAAEGEKILPCNLPADEGEVRSLDQYVVAPGSYVPLTDKEVEKMLGKGEITEQQKEEMLSDPMRGVYTVKNDMPPSSITFKELPQFFIDRYEQAKKKEKEIKKVKLKLRKTPVRSDGKKSALFNLSVHDVVPLNIGPRYPHPLHDSETGANFSVSNGLAHCWRHLVSLNAIQYLVVKSGYMACEDAGTGHHDSKFGSSQVTGDDGAIFYAWMEAKKGGLIPKDDPVPVAALLYIARKHHVSDNVPERWEFPQKRLTPGEYNEVLRIIQEEY